MRARGMVALVPAIALAMSATLAQAASPAASRVAAPTALGTVRFIDHGLAVNPPNKKRQKGRVKMKLFKSYGLHTAAAQRASIKFKDGTLLQMNQRTDAVLQSPSLTAVNQGEVEEVVIPGTKHRVKTAAAVASAIGTVFDVKIAAGVTVVTVVQGVVKVKTPQGTVQVPANHQTMVTPGQAPTPPATVNAQAEVSWSQGIPAPTGNLILNGDAEQGAGAPDDTKQVPAPHWTGTGTFTVVQYGGSGGFPTAKDFGPPNRGKNFFAGGPGAPVSTGTQAVDVSKFAGTIDGSGMVMYASAYLGGYATQNDSATATFTCQNASHADLQHLTLGPTTEKQRGGATGLVEWHGNVHVPGGTRFIVVVMKMTRTDGSYNDGYADNLTLMLDNR